MAHISKLLEETFRMKLNSLDTTDNSETDQVTPKNRDAPITPPPFYSSDETIRSDTQISAFEEGFVEIISDFILKIGENILEDIEESRNPTSCDSNTIGPH